ncbi:Two-component transcriptional response regulator, LuxR family [hydrothermal vent metagenome]|uniref:Two-component transcriptional response regulator, LuxR family n=1 Tax=hydrothermal vent metagenome TaxID=652676 RepID=A0A3B1BSA4_9ZZZZ
MSTINCIICDDEKDALDRTESLLSKLDSINVVAKYQDPEEAIKQIPCFDCDIVFIDVEMPRKTGFDVIKELREQNINPTFIFVTGYNQYAIKAIRAAAFDYLLKPIDIDELKETIDRYRVDREERNNKDIPQRLIEEYSLTPREIEILKLISDGKTSQQIGEMLYISKTTVDTHRRNILEKTQMKSINDLINQLLT